MYQQLINLFALALIPWLTPADCGTAFNHKHDRLKDVDVVISSWNGCAIAGTVDGVAVSLFMDVSSCPLHAKVPGKFRARIDETCGAVLEITDGATITTPMPPSCPTPTPVPTPTPLPTPVPTPTLDTCVLDAPASVLLPANSNGQVTVTLTATISRTRVVTAVSDSGQVFVSPSPQSVDGTSALVGFTLRPKKRGAQITFSSPSCVPRTTVVAVR